MVNRKSEMTNVGDWKTTMNASCLERKRICGIEWTNVTDGKERRKALCGENMR